MAAIHTFTFNIVNPTSQSGDWIASWLAQNPFGGSAWTGRWTANAVNFETDRASGLYEYYQDPPVEGYPGEPYASPEGYYRRSVPFNDGDGQMFDYNAHFYYDATTGLHQVGGGVGTSGGYPEAPWKTWYIRYDPRINKWWKWQNPVGAGTSHHYSTNAMDTVGRKYYRLWNQFDLDDTTPRGHPNKPPYVSIGTPAGWVSATPHGQVFHEGLGRLYVFASSGSGSAGQSGPTAGMYFYWTPTQRNGTTGTWSPINYTGVYLGMHPIGAYHSASQTAVFGGGNAPSRSFWKIGSTGVVSRLDDIPAELATVGAGSPSTMIFDAGLPDALIVFPDSGRSAPVFPSSQIYLLKPNAPPGQQWVVSQDTRAPYLLAWSGYRHHAGFGIPHLGLVAILRAREAGGLTETDLMERFPSVVFYKPSGN